MSERADRFDLCAAFPRRLQLEAMNVLRSLPGSTHAPLFGFNVAVGGEKLMIPYRVYFPEPGVVHESFQAGLEALMVHCLYTCHHDGFVRQRHLAPLLSAEHDWVIPFVLRLLGEYVVEILRLLEAHSKVLKGDSYSRFTVENQTFVELTKQRIVSYWNCYYRGEYPSFSHYPGFLVGQALGWWD